MALRHALKIFKRAVPIVYAGTLFAHCEEKKPEKNDENIVKLDISNLEKLTYDFMIKQSAVDAVNSASQALTVAYTAIESTSKEYRMLLSKLISLMEDTLIYEVSDEHEDMIIAVRSEMHNKKRILTQLIGYMDYVERMAEAVTVVSQSAGMDNVAMSLCKRMDDAHKHKEREITDNKQLEGEYIKLEEKCVKES